MSNEGSEPSRLCLPDGVFSPSVPDDVELPSRGGMGPRVMYIVSVSEKLAD